MSESWLLLLVLFVHMLTQVSRTNRAYIQQWLHHYKTLNNKLLLLLSYKGLIKKVLKHNISIDSCCFCGPAIYNDSNNNSHRLQTSNNLQNALKTRGFNSSLQHPRGVFIEMCIPQNFLIHFTLYSNESSGTDFDTDVVQTEKA